MKAFVLPIAVMLAAGAAGAPVGAGLVLREAPEKATLENPLFAALGSAKEALGDLAYQRADVYFHGGLDRNLVPEHEGSGEQGEAAHDHDNEDAHGAGSHEDWVMRVNRQVRVVEHRHLEASDAREILPLLSVSTALNPRNLDAVLTTAYWLERSTGSPDRSIEVLMRASGTDPEDWRVPFAIGDLLFQKKRQYAGSVPYLEQALARLTEENSQPFDRIRVRYVLAEALLATGQYAEALLRYRDALTLAEKRQSSGLTGVLRQKIAALEARADEQGGNKVI